MPHLWDPTAIAPEEGLARLLAGNARFRAGQGRLAFPRPELAEGAQRPFAIVVGCSDSRTPTEILFDQGFGDLFVVRVAGNVASPAVFGSVEFAASQFGTRLVVVLGHSRCGAIAATLDALESGFPPDSAHIKFITDLIVPTVSPLVSGPLAVGRGSLAWAATRANALAAARALREGSQILADLVAAGRLEVVAAEYLLETGEVQILSE